MVRADGKSLSLIHEQVLSREDLKALGRSLSLLSPSAVRDFYERPTSNAGRLPVPPEQSGKLEQCKVKNQGVHRHVDQVSDPFKCASPVGPDVKEHAEATHEFRRDPARPSWHGWHAFRRGLATNLHRLGVADKEIQTILRHANMSTTMNIYVKSVSADSTAAMKMLEAVMCTDCAPQPTSPSDVMVQ